MAKENNEAFIEVEKEYLSYLQEKYRRLAAAEDTKRNYVKVFQAEGDYSPILVLDEIDEVLVSGDNTYNDGYYDFTKGYALGRGVQVRITTIRGLTQLEECKEELLAVSEGLYYYKEFYSYLKSEEDYWKDRPLAKKWS